MSDTTPPGRPHRILNVNDSPAGRYLVTRMLETAGYEVIECDTGEAALEQVTHPPYPDVIVLDIKLPNLDGFEVCRRIKDDPATADIKILHTSAALVSVSNKVQGLEMGADGYLTQPFETEELVATVRSLLRLRDTERALHDRAERLLEADRRKDEFLAMLGHELRNPLSVLTTSLALLDPYPPRDTIETKTRQVMNRQVRHLVRLVDDLLDVARVTRGLIQLRRQRLDFRDVVTRSVDVAEQIWTRHRDQHLVMALPPEPLPILGDSSRLEQVITNLLHNASKFSDEGADIEVNLQVPEDDPPFAVLRVCDPGTGIDPAALSSIFDTFHQTNPDMARSRGGLGLGLAVVKNLVELHGGQVLARSMGMGCGSELEVRLPLDQTTAEDVQPRPRPEPGQSRGRILLIDDNQDAGEALRALCTSWGYEVALASDGLTGVDMALRERPDIAIVDIGLPGIDGYEVIRRIRSRSAGAGIHLVALTGYGAREVRERALAAGFDAHLIKPVEPSTLSEVLDARRRHPNTK